MEGGTCTCGWIEEVDGGTELTASCVEYVWEKGFGFGDASDIGFGTR